MNQTIKPDEIIISDDHSSDNTIPIIKKMIPNAIIIYNDKKGVVSNFENAIKNSNGKYIFLCDQDDIWQENKIEKILSLLHKYSLIVHNANIIDKNSKIITDETFFTLRNSRKGIIRNLIKSTYLGCCMAFTREVAKLSLPFPKKIEMHDRWLGLIGEICGKVYFLNDTLISYRRHENNTSSGFNKSKYSKIKQFSIRFYIMKEFLKRIIKYKYFKINV